MKKSIFNKLLALLVIMTVSISAVGVYCLNVNASSIDSNSNGQNIDSKSADSINENGNLDLFIDDVSELLEDKTEEETKDGEFNRLIVKAKDGFEIKDENASKCVSGYNNLFIFQYETWELTCKSYDKFLGMNGVEFVEFDSEVTLSEEISYEEESNEEESEYVNWGSSLMKLNSFIDFMHNNSVDEEDVIVAVIDTGINESANSVFDNRIVDGDSFTYLDNKPISYPADKKYSDDNGHGTAVSGIIAQGTDDNVKIMPIKCLDSRGNGSELAVYTGIVYAINKGAKVINLSCCAEGDSLLYEEAMKMIYDHNVSVVAASGNESQDVANVTPSKIPSVITVSSIDKNLRLSSFSNYGAAIDFAAPGGEIEIINYKGGTNVSMGTSFSAPLISAAVALIYSCNIEFTPDDIMEILSENAIDLGEKGWDRFYGYGMVDMELIEDDVIPYVIEANGDANNDGVVDVLDADYVLHSVIGDLKMNEIENARIAVYGQDEATVSHALAILKVIVGITNDYSIDNNKNSGKIKTIVIR